MELRLSYTDPSKCGLLPTLTKAVIFPDSKVHGTNMGSTWALSAPDGPHVGPMNLAFRFAMKSQRVFMILTPWYQGSFLRVYSFSVGFVCSVSCRRVLLYRLLARAPASVFVFKTGWSFYFYGVGFKCNICIIHSYTGIAGQIYETNIRLSVN